MYVCVCIRGSRLNYGWGVNGGINPHGDANKLKGKLDEIWTIPTTFQMGHNNPPFQFSIVDYNIKYEA